MIDEKYRINSSFLVFILLSFLMPFTTCFAQDRPNSFISSSLLRPDNIPQPVDNKMTPERIELGKKLFFDPRLSGSNWISCATCHNPALGWSDGLKTAIGVDMQVLDRSTPTILNIAYQNRQFWDGRAKTMEDQALGPIEAAVEMDQNLDELVKELKAISGYVTLFNEAYPQLGVSKEAIAKAISSFERTIVSTDSKYDRWLKGMDTMSKNEVRGFQLFNGKARCNLCHMGFNFTDNGFHNIGLPNNHDEGRYKIKPIKVLKGAFKTPTLRDIALTAPYMHNGEFATLAQVISHYNSGGKLNMGNLSPTLKPLSLTKQEQTDLHSFLLSLTGDAREITFPQLPLNH